MKNFAHIFFLVLSLSIISCSYFNKENDDSETPVDYNNSEEIDYSNTTEKSVEDQLDDNEVLAIYKDATYNKRATEYSFTTLDGKDITFNVNHIQAKDDLEPIVPENLLESRVGLKGNPGPNPKWIGRTFILVKDDENEVREVLLKD